MQVDIVIRVGIASIVNEKPNLHFHSAQESELQTGLYMARCGTSFSVQINTNLWTVLYTLNIVFKHNFNLLMYIFYFISSNYKSNKFIFH